MLNNYNKKRVNKVFKKTPFEITRTEVEKYNEDLMIRNDMIPK